jgi:hypothetical protein
MDRRKFHRWESKIPCHCKGEDISLSGLVTNLSFKGARVTNPSQIPEEGSEILVTLHPGKERVLLKARVVYTMCRINPPGVEEQFGIEFYGTWDERLEKLMPLFRKYIEAQ